MTTTTKPTHAPPEPVDAEVVDPQGQQRALAVVAPAPAAQDAMRPMSIRDGVALLPVEQQKVVLAEYDDRRNFFMQWLWSHLTEGVHYGYPPGCKPKTDGSGRVLDYKGHVIDPKQWQTKRCLYKAGAALITDLLKLKAVYHMDGDLWLQLGSKPNTIAMKCELLNPSTGDVIGDGRGVFVVGEKSGMGENSSMKMAEKRALVDAVLHTVPVVGEVFTQDLDDPPEARPKPKADESQPKAQPRHERQQPASQSAAPQAAQPGPVPAGSVFKTREYAAMVKAFQEKFPGSTQKQFLNYCIDVAAGLDLTRPDQWTMGIVKDITEALSHGQK